MSNSAEKVFRHTFARFVLGYKSGMLSPHEISESQARTCAAFADAGIVLTPGEAARIEIADFGLSNLPV